MAILIQSKTAAEDKNFWATTWNCFDDGQEIFTQHTGKQFVIDVAANPETAKLPRYYTSTYWLEQRNGNNSQAGIGFSPESFRGSNERNPNPQIVGFDALSLPWEDGWWCNPPFDMKVEFIRKAREEAAKGHAGLMLIPYEPCAGWWVDEVEGYARAVFEPDGRYQFYASDGVTKKTGVNFPVCFVLFANRGIETPRRRIYRSNSRIKRKLH